MMADHCLLYYITDRGQFRGDEVSRRQLLLAKIADAALAGVDYIQLREKDLSARELEILAREMAAAIRENSTSTRFLINSRTDVALAVRADGVHLRTDDVAPRDVRRALEARNPQGSWAGQFLVGASCHVVDDVLRAESEKADFVVFAPVFGKHGPSATEPTGLAALREACRAKVPVLALGGITPDNAVSCLEAGAAGIAGIRLFQENKIEDVVRALRAL
ncbi:MAG: thiamine phosphate synthase [Terriglobales bacterium]